MAQDQHRTGALYLFKQGVRLGVSKYRKLTPLGKLLIWGLILFYALTIVSIIVISPNRIAQFLYDKAQKLAELRFGWVVLFTALVLDAFPPFIGHTTLVTLCGFAYGMKGFWIASSGALVGSTAAFVVLRSLFSERIRTWSGSNEKWQALEAVVRAKGLPLIVLIRMSPFPPWVYSNSLFASIEPVKLWQFAFATVWVFPKIAVYVFTGSRIASLSDGDQRSRMDTQTKIANWILVGGGFFISGLAGWLIYRLVKSEIKKTRTFSPEVDRLANEAYNEAAEGAPLLRDFSEPGVSA